MHPSHPSSQYQFVGLLRGSESLNDIKLLKHDLTDATVYMPKTMHAVGYIDVLPCVDTTYRGVCVSFSSSTPESRQYQGRGVKQFLQILAGQFQELFSQNLW